MKNEQRILDATEYILMTLDNIKNYNDFIEYKDEFNKAILDIKNSVINLIQNNSNKANLKDSHEESQSIFNSNKKVDNDNNSYLSSISGPKFNNDYYSNEKQKKNLFLNNQNLYNLNNSNNKNNLNYLNENYNNDIISYNKSLRNKLNSNNANSNVKKNNNNMNYNNIRLKYKTEENIYPMKNNGKEIINNNNLTNKKDKINKIADIILKINNDDYIYEILTKLFGENLTDQLMSNNVDDNLLEAIQDSIKEIESLKQKDEYNINKNKNNKKINKTYNEEIEERPRIFPIEILMSKNTKNSLKKSNSHKKIDYKKNNDAYKEYNFIKGLRNNIRKHNYGQKNKIISKSSNKIRKEKPFINATSPYGNYFDAPLQNGGFSKLGAYKK